MSQDMNDDPFAKLSQTPAPDPRADAKKRALAAGMAAFEASQTKSVTAPKGNAWGQRLISIIASLKGNRIMDLRYPIGTLAIALLVLPLGYQLYSSTTLTPPAPVRQASPAPQPAEPAQAITTEAAPPELAPMPTTIAPQDDAVADDAPQVEPPLGTIEPQANAPAADARDTAAPVPLSPAPIEPAMPQSSVMAESAPMAQSLSQDSMMRMPSPGIIAPSSEPVMAPPPAESGDQFASFDEQRLKIAAEEPVSTFSIDVDTASYAYVRRMLEDGYVPEPDAVRIEEMVNYFPYDYLAADSAAVPFKPTIGVFPTPWNPKTQLLQIGIKGYVPPAGEDQPANLVFLIDTSGSMDEPDKLPLLKRAFALLVDQLSANDTVSIVAYTGSAGVVLKPTVATDKAAILDALDNLMAGGSTAGAEGIELAYRLAEQAKVGNGGTNRVILATDGDFNVGIDDPEKLEDFIKAKRQSGISLSVLGFGQGNLGDATMQALAQNGNGNASYISSVREAQKVLVTEIGGTLDMIAKDVKIQVEFNPAVVSEYRLIGYETRALNREDFNNDAVDAGDVGAGTTVTALYEITPVGSSATMVDPLRYGTSSTTPAASGDEIAFLRMRYKLPDSDVSQLIEQPITPSVVHGNIGDVSDDMRFAAAVAAFGQKLRGSDYGGDISWQAIEALARSGKGADDTGYRAEFIQLVQSAAMLAGPSAAPAD